ncbi:hypothetical protein GF415_01745 [Candidatus Micrarchaeota archaeon]|nr:hypothetical protein [Candidatus Micrarchaeota archaeon]
MVQAPKPIVDLRIVAYSLFAFVILFCFLNILVWEVSSREDQAFWFSLEDPGGGPLSYPPFVKLLFQAMHLISGEDLNLFSRLLAMVSFAAFFGIIFLFNRMGIPRQELIPALVAFAPVYLLIFNRVEVITVLFSLAAVFLFYRGQRLGGWLSAFTGALFKVVSALFAPLFMAIEFRRPEKSTIRRISFLILLGLLAFFVFEDNFRTVAFHSARGLQVESVYANFLMLLNQIFDLGISVDYCYGSYHLVLPAYLEFFVPMALILQIAVVLAVSWLYYLEGAKKERLFFYAFLLSLGFIVTMKVFSPQFILFPFFFAVPVISKMKGWNLHFAIFFISFFTFLVYPVGWQELINMNPVAISFLTLRNLGLIALFAWLLKNREKISCEY